MSEVKWTKEQQNAITKKDSNILVAAAAGSGKTAVLVERIIKKIIDDKVDIDKILVVTFTNAAAAEMRERILDAIYEKIEKSPDDQNLQKQIILLNKASICTIDSFCLDVIKNNFYEIDVSANTRIADSTEMLLLKQEVLDDLFEEKYIASDKNFLELIDTYTKYNRDEELKDLILKIYTYIQANPFPEKWLNEKVEMLNVKDNIEYKNFSNTPWGKIITKNVESQLENAILKLENIAIKLQRFPEIIKPKNIINQDIAVYSEIKENLSNWNKSATLLINLDPKQWSSDKNVTNDLVDEAKEIRTKIKDEMKETKKLMPCLSEEALDDITYMYNILKKLKDLILEFSERFYQKKREKNIMDFNDMEHLALKLLVKEDESGNIVKTDIAKRYEEKFEEIAIDEYQDSNLVQEHILTSVSRGNNIFMVGDVKQSIYKFRQARPQLFLEKYNKYSLEPEQCQDRKIQLFKNFRSRKNILDFTNLVFENIMSHDLGDIDYNENEYLNLGASYENIPDQNFTTEIEVIDTSNENNDIWKEEKTEEVANLKENITSIEHNLKEKSINTEVNSKEENKEASSPETERVEDVVLEARFVAKKIKELIDSKYIVNDKKTGPRPIKYKDIAILLRTITGVANVFEKEISELGIPVYSDSSGEYLQSIEIETIMSLLRIINNPMQDIPLVTVMRSPIGNFTDNELIEIRMNDRKSTFYEALLQTNTQKVKGFLSLLEELRNDEQYMALDEWIWNIYTKTGYMNYVSLMPNGNLRVSNLKMLFERAKQYESASFKGLFNFINFIDKIKFNSEDLTSAKIIGENEDVVRIMSIHKSKGLEFPVVILAGAGKQFNFTDLSDKILLDQDLGIGPDYIDIEKRITFKTLAKNALAIKVRNEAISEEMRVLYVALTRPKEKLIVVGRQKDVNKKIAEKQKVLEVYSMESSKKINPYLLEKYKTYLDWLELIYLKEGAKKTKDIFTFKINSKFDLLKNAKIETESENIYDKILQNVEKMSNDNQEEIKQTLQWKYPHNSLEGIPTKTSVTKLKEASNVEQLQENTRKVDFDISEDKDYTDETTKQTYLNATDNLKNKEDNLNISKNSVITEKPKFLNESKNTKITTAQKGTLIHLCVQKMNEKQEYDINKINEMIEDLQNKELITKLEAQNINIDKLLQYTKSELWQELKEAKEVHKEQPFYINIKASEIYDSIDQNEDENILVQGIIDLYFINKNGQLILVDYKTDYVENGQESNLIEKYRKQLEIYKDALENALNRKVDKIGIYSLYLNKMLFLDL